MKRAKELAKDAELRVMPPAELESRPVAEVVTTVPITRDRRLPLPGWPREFTRLPVVKRFTTAQHVSHRDGLMPVELIGPVHASGHDGPTNGMYALQKELRKRIAGGMDWQSIKSLPASDGALPWYWHWDDRRYAVWCDSEGRPFVQGPNMLFTYS